MTETLPLTGERTAPGIWHENYWFARHDAAYRWITEKLASTVVPKTGRVLDAGCGEGYGAELLRRAGADSVVGLDYEGTTLRHLAKAYPQISLVQGNLVQTGFTTGAFDLVVSLQTIEHLWEQPRFISECRRILSEQGQLVLSTPNRLTFPSGNWYHTRELTAAEFVELVAPEFEIIDLLGLWHGERLARWESQYGSCVDAQLADDHDSWPENLAALVRETRYQDFDIRPSETKRGGGKPSESRGIETGPDDLDDSLDLIVLARPRTT